MHEATKRINEWLLKSNDTDTLDISKLNLKRLPENFPRHIKILYCSNNQLTSLPALSNCIRLDCYNNHLTSLPALPNCTILQCNKNHLRSLPALPNCTALYCQNNQLTRLPALPNCTKLDCYNKYLHIDSHIAHKFNIPETPDYNKNANILQKRFRYKYTYKHITTISIFIDEVKYRPDSILVSEIASKYSTTMII